MINLVSSLKALVERTFGVLKLMMDVPDPIMCSFASPVDWLRSI